MFQVSKVLFLSVLFHGLSTGSASLGVTRPERKGVLGTLGCTVGVGGHVIVIEFLLREFSDEFAGVTAPDLASRDQSADGHHAVWKDHGSAFNASTSTHNRSCADNAVVVDDAAVDAAAALNGHVLADVDGR